MVRATSYYTVSCLQCLRCFVPLERGTVRVVLLLHALRLRLRCPLPSLICPLPSLAAIMRSMVVMGAAWR